MIITNADETVSPPTKIKAKPTTIKRRI